MLLAFGVAYLIWCSYKKGKSAIHMVSAFAAENGVVLGQIKTEDKSNEITAIPALLDLLDTKGCIVTIDAIGCQEEIATKIIDKKSDYILAVKDNQKNLHDEIIDFYSSVELYNHQHCPIAYGKKYAYFLLYKKKVSLEYFHHFNLKNKINPLYYYSVGSYTKTPSKEEQDKELKQKLKGKSLEKYSIPLKIIKIY
jgi:predicted transposase YbfD/YdcC